MDFGIAPLDGGTAAEAELRAWYELFAAVRAEDFPDFPVTPYASFAEQRRAPRQAGPGSTGGAGGIGGGSGPRAFAARAQDGTLLGVGTLGRLDGVHAGWAVPLVQVAADYRRRGIGTALLRALVTDAGAPADGDSAVVTDAGAEGMRLVQEGVRVGSAGEHWARAVGFTETLRNCWQMLHVQQTDPRLWRVPTPEGFRLEQWTGAAPERLVAAFAAARNAIGDAPRGDSGYRAPVWTVERVRRAEAEARAAGDELRYAVAVHEASGEIAALTGLLLVPPRIDLCWQRDTAVARGYRGLGLGRVVKAAMMRALVAEHPGLGRVITNTAAQNTAMIRVNERIGYVRNAEIAMFEAELGRLAAALGDEKAVDDEKVVDGAVIGGEAIAGAVLPGQRRAAEIADEKTTAADGLGLRLPRPPRNAPQRPRSLSGP